MIFIREFNGIQLNEGNMMASGLYNVSTIDDVSLWFDDVIKDELMECDDDDFEERAKELIENAQIN